LKIDKKNLHYNRKCIGFLYIFVGKKGVQPATGLPEKGDAF